MSSHSLYEWRKKYSVAIDKDDEQSEEIRRLKRELVRVTEERDILKSDHDLGPPVRGRNWVCYSGHRRLMEMNLQLHHVAYDITGGNRHEDHYDLRAIVSGERNQRAVI